MYTNNKISKVRVAIICLVLFTVINVIIKMPDMNFSDWVTLFQGIVIGLVLAFVALVIDRRRGRF